MKTKWKIGAVVLFLLVIAAGRPKDRDQNKQDSSKPQQEPKSTSTARTVISPKSKVEPKQSTPTETQAVAVAPPPESKSVPAKKVYPEIRFGLTEAERLRVWHQLCWCEDRAMHESRELNKRRKTDDNEEFFGILNEQYRLQVAEKYNLTAEQLTQISAEAVDKLDEWPEPEVNPSFKVGIVGRKAKPITSDEAADRALLFAKKILPRNPSAGKRRLREILDKYPDSPAAKEARTLLGK